MKKIPHLRRVPLRKTFKKSTVCPLCVWLKHPECCCFSSKDGLVVAFGWPDSAVRVDEPLNKAVHLSNIPSGQTPDNSPAFAVCVWECVSVCVCWMEAKPCQHSLLHLTLFHSLSLSPLHFHVYRLGLMVCILTILVWKPADSPALWARQGRRFIREEGREGVTPDISSHGTSLQYFSSVMWLPGQMSGHSGLCRRASA